MLRGNKSRNTAPAQPTSHSASQDDYFSKPKETLSKAFEFLGLRKLDDAAMQQLLTGVKVNSFARGQQPIEPGEAKPACLAFLAGTLCWRTATVACTLRLMRYPRVSCFWKAVDACACADRPLPAEAMKLLLDLYRPSNTRLAQLTGDTRYEAWNQPPPPRAAPQAAGAQGASGRRRLQSLQGH
jgi:hypothetical protein